MIVYPVKSLYRKVAFLQGRFIYSRILLTQLLFSHPLFIVFFPQKSMNHNIIGYGSLISHRDLRETIPDKHFKPVIVRGYKRIFNLALKTKGYPNVLNIEKSPQKQFNGVLFKINEKELRDLMKREAVYNLEKTNIYDFTTKQKLGRAYVVIDHIVAIDHKKRKPNKKYFILCREAAYQIDRKFGQFWDNTTYISNGKKVKDWIKNNKSFDTIKG